MDQSYFYTVTHNSMYGSFVSQIKDFTADELTLDEWNAQIGLLRGNDTLPDERTEIAGLITFRVAP